MRPDTSGQWTFGVNDYWSPDNFQMFGEVECDRGIGRLCLHKASCSTSSRPPSAARLVTRRTRRLPSDYTYWNAGLTLGFMEQLFRRCPLLGHGLQRDRVLHPELVRRTNCDARVGRHPQGGVLRFHNFPKKALPTSKGADLGALSLCGCKEKVLRAGSRCADGPRACERTLANFRELTPCPRPRGPARRAGFAPA